MKKLKDVKIVTENSTFQKALENNQVFLTEEGKRLLGIQQQ